VITIENHRWKDCAPLTPGERAQLAAWVEAIGLQPVAARAGLSGHSVLRRAHTGGRVSPDTREALVRLFAQPLPERRTCRRRGCDQPVAPAPPVGARPCYCPRHACHDQRTRRRPAPAPVCPACGGPLAHEGRLAYCRLRRCDAALALGAA
jgi:hypothetical protein